MLTKTELTPLLIQYLQDVLDCEARLLGLRGVGSIAESRVSELERELERTTLPAEPTRHEVSVSRNQQTAQYKPAYTMPIIGVILIIIGLITWFMSGGIFAVAGVILIAVGLVKNRKKQNEENQRQADVEAKARADATVKADSDYKNAMTDFSARKQTTENKIRDINESMRWLRLQASEATRYISDTEPVLRSLYEQGVLHPKYRNITAVASILDYVSTGRTESLTRAGSDPGAYNIYEDDVRAGRIINAINVGFDRMGTRMENAIDSMGNMIGRKIDSIMQALEENQHSLYSAISEGNCILQSVSNDVGATNRAISENNAISRGIANNSRILVDLNRDFYGNLRDRGGHHVDED